VLERIHALVDVCRTMHRHFVHALTLQVYARTSGYDMFAGQRNLTQFFLYIEDLHTE